MFNKIYKIVIMCFLQNGLTSHMDPYTTTNVKTLQLGVALLYLGPICLYTSPLIPQILYKLGTIALSCSPFTYIQDHLMPQEFLVGAHLTLQDHLMAHRSSWGPFTYIQDHLIWGPFTYIQDHLMPQIKTLQVGAHCSSWGPFTYIQDQLI